MTQISLFDGNKKFVINKPIRLIELFAGYGSQHFALKYLGVKFESWKICEWAVKSIQSYRDAHFGEDKTNYSATLFKDEIIEYLANKGISSNYNEPMTFEQVKRLGEDKLRTIYNNIQATHNLVNIQQVKGKDLEIVDTDKYTYVMTYSFPCQDLSSAGKQAGMEKGSGTRSGMLWEVERILDELNLKGKVNLPQILLMENVPEVIGTNNVKHFAKWLEKLESLGYKCYWQVLNAKDYGVPQNRERCFMVSILGDYYYEFPSKIKLEHKLKDLLEKNVDKKYYLSNLMKKYISTMNDKWIGNNNGGIVNKEIASTLNTGEDHRRCDASNYICDGLKENFNLNYLGTFQYSKSDNFMKGKDRYQPNKEISDTLQTTQKEGIVEFGSYFTWQNKKGEINTQCNRANNPNNCALTIACSNVGKVLEKFQIRKLTPKECFRLMGVKDQDYEKIATNQSDASLYHLAGDSIVVNVLMAIFIQII